ncbi:MAG: C39 family peptidase [Acidobacteriota bacterium]
MGIVFKTLAGVMCSCVVLAACASAPPAARQGETVIDNVPFYPQEAYQCGPASLAGVLNYEGFGTTPERIAEEIFSRSARGTLTLDMVLYAQRNGFSAHEYAGSMQDLKEKISVGQPLLVMVDYGFLAWQADHFMVVVGYSTDGIIANSGKKEREFIQNDTFLRIWKKAGFWSLSIKKK